METADFLCVAAVKVHPRVAAASPVQAAVSMAAGPDEMVGFARLPQVQGHAPELVGPGQLRLQCHFAHSEEVIP